MAGTHVVVRGDKTHLKGAAKDAGKNDVVKEHKMPNDEVIQVLNFEEETAANAFSRRDDVMGTRHPNEERALYAAKVAAEGV